MLNWTNICQDYKSLCEVIFGKMMIYLCVNFLNAHQVVRDRGKLRLIERYQESAAGIRCRCRGFGTTDSLSSSLLLLSQWWYWWRWWWGWWWWSRVRDSLSSLLFLPSQWWWCVFCGCANPRKVTTNWTADDENYWSSQLRGPYIYYVITFGGSRKYPSFGETPPSPADYFWIAP